MRSTLDYVGIAEEAGKKLLAHPAVQADPEMPGRAGCVFYLAPRGVHDPEVWQPILKPNRANIARYKQNARNKIAGMYMAECQHLRLSYLCRDELTFYGGAVVGNDWNASISGWTEDVDEIHSLLVLIRIRDITLGDALDLLAFRAALREITLEGGRKIAIVPNSKTDVLKSLY